MGRRNLVVCVAGFPRELVEAPPFQVAASRASERLGLNVVVVHIAKSKHADALLVPAGATAFERARPPVPMLELDLGPHPGTCLNIQAIEAAIVSVAECSLIEIAANQ